MRSIAVILAIRPRLLREIVRHVLERTGQITVEHELSHAGSLLEMADADSPVVVQWLDSGDHDRANAVWTALFEARPGLTVLSLEPGPEQIRVLRAGNCVSIQPLNCAQDLVRTLQEMIPASVGATDQDSLEPFE